MGNSSVDAMIHVWNRHLSKFCTSEPTKAADPRRRPRFQLPEGLAFRHFRARSDQEAQNVRRKRFAYFPAIRHLDQKFSLYEI
jgi:hypothetical protein